jgi:hypothetical protein
MRSAPMMVLSPVVVTLYLIFSFPLTMKGMGVQ